MRVGFANGCFDLFHAGHHHFLTECRRHCDYLVVAVNSDEYCRRVKGPTRPFDPLKTRIWNVRQLAEAAIPFEGREEQLILEIRPQIVFKGGDHSRAQVAYAARGVGWKEGVPLWWAPVLHIPRLPGVSTTLCAQLRK